MSDSGTAFELPTNRQSRHYDRPVYDVHDPNYIPVLSSTAEIRVDFTKPTFSALPSIPKPHESPAQIHLKRSKSGSAPETVVHGSSDSIASRRYNVASRNIEPQELGKGHAPASVQSIHSTEDDSASTSGLSSTTASAQLESNVFMIPGNTAPKKEELQGPGVPHSARSSISSVKRPMVPTSRFSQKQPSLPSIPAAVARNASPRAPFTTPKSTPELPSQSPQITTPRSTPVIPIPPIPSPEVSQTAHRSQTMKSTASERRARALHSHPYTDPMPSKPSSIVDEAEEAPLIKQPPLPDSRPPSIRSRTQSICSSMPATPAPTAPLPDLPPGAKRPPTRERLIEKPSLLSLQQSQPSPLPPSVPEKDHVEMAEFMKKQRTTVFRRFDDVHIRLLLHLQDEITTLEKELLESERKGLQEPESLSKRRNIMSELRKALAEYGKFSKRAS